MAAPRSLWNLLRRQNETLDTATDIYGRLVALARAEAFYAANGVPDTPDGRLELIVFHLALMLERLKIEGERGMALARALNEAFVTDFDDCLREMGVSDLKVPEKVKKAAAALYDRTRDYGAALDEPEVETMVAMVQRHLQRFDDVAMKNAGVTLAAADASRQGALRIARYAAEMRSRLTAVSLDEIVAGTVRFPVPGTGRGDEEGDRKS